MKSTDMKKRPSLKVSGAQPEALDVRTAMLETSLQNEKERDIVYKDALLRMILEKTDMVAYRYDVAKDETTLWQAAPDEEMKEVHHQNFRTYFIEEVLADASRQEDVIEHLEDACRRVRDDTVEYCVKTSDGTPLWRRTSYRSLAMENGEVYAIVGFMENIHDAARRMEQQEARLKRDPKTRLFDRDGLELLVNHQLMELSHGEKGVLFIVSIDDYEELCRTLGEAACNSYIAALSNSVRTDFRGVDVFGRLNRDEVVIFISGRVSIDIIEKRAQRILDLFLRVQPQDHEPVSFSMGISVTGSTKQSFEHMVKEADEAMLSARKFGPNRCRMYDDIKG